MKVKSKKLIFNELLYQFYPLSRRIPRIIVEPTEKLRFKNFGEAVAHFKKLCDEKDEEILRLKRELEIANTNICNLIHQQTIKHDPYCICSICFPSNPNKRK